MYFEWSQPRSVWLKICCDVFVLWRRKIKIHICLNWWPALTMIGLFLSCYYATFGLVHHPPWPLIFRRGLLPSHFEFSFSGKGKWQCFCKEQRVQKKAVAKLQFPFFFLHLIGLYLWPWTWQPARPSRSATSRPSWRLFGCGEGGAHSAQHILHQSQQPSRRGPYQIVWYVAKGAFGKS